MSNVYVADQPEAARAGRPTGRLLEVEDLRVEFRTRDGVAKVINGVTYHVDAGETLAVLGESGSGKSVTAQTIMGILDTPPGFVTGGEVRFHGKDTWMVVRFGIGILDSRAATLEAVDTIERSSIDFYATTRNLYRQSRNAKINEGNTSGASDDLPNL